MKTENFLHELLPADIEIDDFLLSAYRTAERQALRDRGTLFDGVKEVLQDIFEHGHQLYICSSGSEEYIKLVLEKTDISDFVKGIYSSRNYRDKSEAVREIAAGTKKCVVIGDTINDIKSGKENKFPSIAVTYGYGKTEDYKEADYIVNKPAELPPLVEQISVNYDICDRIKEGTCIIGINGVDTSGKTTFTDRFSHFLSIIGRKSTVLHMDDFHNPRAIRNTGINENEAYYNCAFNVQQVLNEILVPLSQNKSLDKDVVCLNLDTDCYSEKRHYCIQEGDVLLIEGVLLFREPLDTYLDMRIFIDVTFDEVFRGQ